MLHKLIEVSQDLKRLRDQGYEVHIKGTLLLVSGVPYLNSNMKVKRGTLVSELSVTSDGARTISPRTHVIHFIGEHPCNKDGTKISQLTHSEKAKNLGDGVTVNMSFSHKPGRDYID